MKETAKQEVHGRMLDAAEELFAIHGYNGASMRSITRKAGVNLAAIHYHLGDKQLLYEMVLCRRLRPINEARLAKLEICEQQAHGRPVPLAQVIEIMARPLFELGEESTPGGRNMVRLLGRSLCEPLSFMDKVLTREFQSPMTRFGQAMRRHVPNLPPEEFLWRLSFVIGAMHHTLATLHQMKELSRGICRNHDQAGALPRFMQFAEAAIRAPSNAVSL